ncbi:MAG: hypothetical protein XD84_0854 [Desulfotomaculum sp. 46_80]|nr:MAG: hypothetical protein XD84_0854 [Desulfotomaculum sp. 46_80]
MIKLSDYNTCAIKRQEKKYLGRYIYKYDIERE